MPRRFITDQCSQSGKVCVGQIDTHKSLEPVHACQTRARAATFNRRLRRKPVTRRQIIVADIGEILWVTPDEEMWQELDNLEGHRNWNAVSHWFQFSAPGGFEPPARRYSPSDRQSGATSSCVPNSYSNHPCTSSRNDQLHVDLIGCIGVRQCPSQIEGVFPLIAVIAHWYNAISRYTWVLNMRTEDGRI